MGLKFKMTLTAAVIIGLFSIAEGAWQGPTEMISGTWGPNNDQFGIEYGDTNDVFGGPFYILLDENIILTDLMNGRMKIYNSNGALVKVTKCEKGPTAEWNEVCRIPLANYIQTIPDGNIWVGPLDYLKQQGYSLYSPAGQLIKTMTTRPADLGYINETRMSGGKYKYTLKYPDGTYTLISGTIFEEGLVRDQSTNLYGIGTITNPQDIYVTAEWEGNTISQTPQPHYIVSRFSPCGKLQGRVDIPSDRSKFKKTSTGVIRDESLLRQYGKPIVAPNGDVYTWQRTSTTYSILKWTWVDDPNVPTGPDAPSGLSVMPSTSGIYLTWTASPQDPGCVTGYEVCRATSAGGVGTTIATVNAGVLKYNDTSAAVGTTYYYKIRAVAGSEYSPYTSEVSGKR